ncbi:hypothetical protein CRENBAI_011659 [Crenichthys baileyi]|uniref:Uncharacterized protein n=1 Tax=Crenichthys baileyi TaxID=28760 RepID=A0AAV9RM91_9TELE
MADMNFTDLITVFYLWRTEKRRRRRRPWVHQILQQREQFGEYHHLLQELRLDDGPSSKICCPALGDESASPTTGAVSPLLNACPSDLGE